jgi:uncharacterized membrane protein
LVKKPRRKRGSPLFPLFFCVLLFITAQAASVDIGPLNLVFGSDQGVELFSDCIVDPNDGGLILAEYSENRLRKVANVNSYNSAATPYWGSGIVGNAVGSSTSSRFNIPWGVAFNGNGTLLFVSNYEGQTISRINIRTGLLDIWAGTGVAGTAEGTGTTNTQLNGSSGMYYHASTNELYVTEQGSHRICIFDSAAKSSTLAGNPSFSTPRDGTGTSAYFDQPVSLDYDGSVNQALLVVDRAAHTMRLVTLAGVVTTPVGRSGTKDTTDGRGTAARLCEPFAIRVHKGYAYVTQLCGSVRRIDLASFIVSSVLDAETGSIRSLPYFTMGLCFGPDDKMYVTPMGAILEVLLGSNATARPPPPPTPRTPVPLLSGSSSESVMDSVFAAVVVTITVLLF